jgi:hypothetical protein
LPVEKAGRAAPSPGGRPSPAGAAVRVLLDGTPLKSGKGTETVPFRSAHTPGCYVNFKPVELKAGTAAMVIECVEPGPVGLDYLWVKYQ